MPAIELQGKHYELAEHESVLDGLLRHQVAIPHGCRAGACQSCLLQLVEGTVAPAAQNGLKESQKQLGYFFACVCQPTANLKVSLVDQAKAKATARILDITRLNASVVRLRLQSPFAYRAGQYINIWLNDFTVRSYSIASVVALNDFIELHVKELPQGQFSSVLLPKLVVGESLIVQGPLGQCFYCANDPTQTLLLVGIGTGLAPLYGIVQDALLRGHSGPIHLIVGARSADHFYLSDPLKQLAVQYANFQVAQVALDSSGYEDVISSDLYAFVKIQFPSTKGFQVYLCGAESFVRKMKKQCFLAGAAMKDIHADAFLPCG